MMVAAHAAATPRDSGAERKRATRLSGISPIMPLPLFCANAERIANARMGPRGRYFDLRD
jgi:hypothetical protein